MLYLFPDYASFALADGFLLVWSLLTQGCDQWVMLCHASKVIIHDKVSFFIATSWIIPQLSSSHFWCHVLPLPQVCHHLNRNNAFMRYICYTVLITIAEMAFLHCSSVYCETNVDFLLLVWFLIWLIKRLLLFSLRVAADIKHFSITWPPNWWLPFKSHSATKQFHISLLLQPWFLVCCTWLWVKHLEDTVFLILAALHSMQICMNCLVCFYLYVILNVEVNLIIPECFQ